MTQIKLRRDTSANFTSKNPVLGLGEPAYETDTKKLKIGDGTTAYTQLEYFSAGGGGSADIGAALPLKIVDGVISLEVDGRTIQIVDGKLHTSNNIFDISKFTVVGSPTITDDGVASNLSSSGYFTAPFINFKDKAFSFKAKVKFTDLTGSRNTIFGQKGKDYILPSLCLAGDKLRVYRPIDGTMHDSWNVTTFTPQINTWYNIELIMDLSYIIVKINGDEIAKKASSGITFDIGSNVVCLGTTLSLTSWKLDGSIDLKQFSITVDGKEVFNGLMNSTKPIYDAIKANNTELSEFKTETSNDFSAVDSALNEKANLSDLALKQNKLTAGDNITLTNLTDKTVRIDATYTGLEVCDIGTALYVDETKGLRRYLNGQVVDINTNTQAFLNRLKEITTLHPSLLCTEDEWQTAKTMSAFGQVGKFVFNYSGETVVSVRIPRVVNIQGLFDLQNLGMTVAESLPQHTHYIGDRLPSITSAGGNPKADVNGNDGYSCVRISNTQGASSSIYQDNAHVQPEAIQYPYFIQIATGQETENNIINDIELNNPYSLFDSKYSDHELNNISWLKSNGQWNAKATYPTAYNKLLKVYNGTETVEGLSVKLSTETYTDYDFVLNTSDETFRLPLKTKLASGKAIVGNGMTLGLTNGTQTGGLAGYSNGSTNANIAYKDTYGVTVGNTTTGTSITGSLGVTTDPTKSGIELSDSGLYLYYYVGETVQNANLIDAGRIGEQLATKEDINTWVYYQNGTSGYRYNRRNGYCEQWGYKSGTTSETITFLKAFKDTNYNVVMATEKASNFFQGNYSNKTTTNMKINYTGNTGGSALGTSWMVTGYIA